MKIPLPSRATPRVILLAVSTCFTFTAKAQRLTLPESSSSVPASNLATSPAQEGQGQILKTYPNGTKRTVPLSSLNSWDDGKDFGGPPTLSFLEPTQNSSSNKNLPIAPIGDSSSPSTASVAISPPADSSAVQVPLSNPDPMGGSAMGGSAPVDPLSGAPTTPTPLQTVSGKPAPLSDGGVGTTDLGTYDDFFMNTSVGGSIQGQLTSRRVFNGNNMQAYPYKPSTPSVGAATISAENFTFEPGFRFDVEFGYNIYDWLGVSLQSGVIYNAVNQYNLTVADAGTLYGKNFAAGSYQLPADGELLQVPIQLDGILRWPGKTAFKPFIGGGVGAIWQQLDVNNFTYNTSNIQANYCRSAFQFGFNGQVGANYTVSPGVDFYGVFKLLGAFTPRIGNYDFENSYNFALEVGIQSRF